LKRLLLSFAFVAATTTAASAQVTGPLTPAPPQTGPTSRLLFDAMMATANAAAAGHPAAAQNARINYEAAMRQFQAGNEDAARASATAALRQAAGGASGGLAPGPVQPMRPYAAPYVPQTVVVPGTIASINADAFVAAARRSVNACVAAKSPMSAIAQQRLAAAERDNAAGQYGKVVASAQDIVDLCASAQAGRQAP
jgi:hypothetical protein